MPRDPPVADLLRGEGTSPGGPGPAKPGLEEEEGGGVSGGAEGARRVCSDLRLLPALRPTRSPGRAPGSKHSC